MKKRVNKKKKRMMKIIKMAKYMVALSLISLAVYPLVTEKNSIQVTESKYAHYGDLEYSLEDIVSTKLYYTGEDNYVEVTVLDEESMENGEYVIEVELEENQILRYNVENIEYEDNEFVIGAEYKESEDRVFSDKVELDFSAMSIDSGIALMSNTADVETINDGTIVVNTYEEFINVIGDNLDGNIVLGCDIDFTGYSSSTGYIISDTFTGTLDGQNHQIVNLTSALFKLTDGATISNVVIKNSNIAGSMRAIFVDTMTNTTVDNVHITESVFWATVNNGNGPFSGCVTSSNLSNISVTDTIIGGAKFLGGLFGLSYGSTNVENAYVETDIRNYTGYVGGVVTLGYSGSSINIKNSIINVRMDTNLESYKGGIYAEKGSGNLEGVVINLTTEMDGINKIAETVLYSGAITASGSGVYTVAQSGGMTSGFDFEQEISKTELTKEFYAELGLDTSVWNLDEITDGMPKLKSYQTLVEEPKNEEENAKVFIDVGTAEELIDAISKDNSANINLTNNINFLLYDGVNASMITDTYSGTFNGNGYAILNLTVALFNTVDGAEVSNLLIGNADVTGRTGIFAGAVKNSTIQSVHIKDSYLYCTNTSNGVAGFIGAITSSIIDDVSIIGSEIIGSKRSGGLAGYAFGINYISNIYIDSTTTITNDSDATGGLIGQSGSYTHVKNAIIAPVFNSNGSSNRGGICGYGTGMHQFVNIVVTATSTSADSIATNIPILHGSTANVTGNTYEWEESNLKKQYNYTYSSLLSSDEITDDFFVDTLNFDTSVWDINSASSSNLPSLKSYAKMVEKYEATLPEITVDLKTVSQYDALIKQKYTVSENQVLTEEVEYLVLLRNLVNNVGYDLLYAYAVAGESESQFVNWLMQYETIKKYTEAGEPDGGSYTASMRVLYELYTTYGDDLNNRTDTGKGGSEVITYGDVYEKLMFSISHTHATAVGLWVSKSSTDHYAPNNSSGLRRYEIYKNMMIADLELDGHAPEESITTSILDDIFYTLEMEEMRYVVNGIIDDESVEWMEWYVRTKKGDARGGYSLLSYTTGYVYTDSKYYQDESVWNEKYGISDFGLTYSSSYPKQWVVFEEGGVCGAISKSAVNAQTSNGRPATVVSQPGHAAYTIMFQNSDGDNYWSSVQTSLATWAQTGKTERMNIRMPNGWGSDSSVTGYAASYLFISQTALNDYDNYVASEMELLLAQVYAGDSEKQEIIYFNSIDKLDYNLDAWLGLARLYAADETKTDEEKYQLVEKMAEGLKYQPLPLYNVSNIVTSSITDEIVLLKLSNLMFDTYTAATTVTTNEILQATGVAEVASYLLGIVDTTVATFSFDGENPGQIVLGEKYEGTENVWFGSVDGGATWIEANGMSLQLTDDQLAKINVDNGVRIYFSGSDANNVENHYIMEIVEGTTPVFTTHSNTAALFANDLENRVIGGPNSNDQALQWYDSNAGIWKLMDDEMPDLSGDTTVEVSYCATGNMLQSATTTASFTTNTDTDERKYVSIDRLSIEDSSSLWSTSYDYYAIDGTTNTMFHSAEQTNNHITIKVDEPIYMTGFEYTPRLAGTNGIVTVAEIYTSIDNENWTLATTETWAYTYTTKVVDFEEPVYAKYVKLVATTSQGNFLSTTMINLFEDITEEGVIEIQYSNLNQTNQDVTATLVGENITITNNGGNNAYTFTQNGEFTFEYVASNNYNRQITAKVSNIDKEKPTAGVSYETGEGVIIATIINPSEEITVTNNDGDDKYSFRENGEFVFEIVDTAGNEEQIVATVKNISYAYIKIGDEVYGDGEEYSKENPYELPTVYFAEDETREEIDGVTDDIEIYLNNQKVDLEVIATAMTRGGTEKTYTIEVTTDTGFTTYFVRTLVVAEQSGETEEDEEDEEDKIDKQALKEKLEYIYSLDLNKYTTETIEHLETVIDAASIVLDDENATIDEVEKAIADLEDAIEKLVEMSTNNKLSKLEVGEYELAPEFDPEVYEYSIFVEDIESFEDIIVETEDEKADYIITGNEDFIEGINVVSVQVTAENGETVIYKITVTKTVLEEEDEEEEDSQTEELSTDATLSYLEVIGYELTPEFNSTVHEYTLNIIDIDYFEKIAIKTNNSKATCEIEGNTNFEEGVNEMRITVTAEDGITTKIYTIKVQKEGTKVLKASIELENIEVIENGTVLKITAIVRDENQNILQNGTVVLDLLLSDGDVYKTVEMENLEGKYEAEVAIEKNSIYTASFSYISEIMEYEVEELIEKVDSTVEEELEEEQEEEAQKEETDEEDDDTVYPSILPDTGNRTLLGITVAIVAVLAITMYKKNIKKNKRRKRYVR